MKKIFSIIGVSLIILSACGDKKRPESIPPSQTKNEVDQTNTESVEQPVKSNETSLETSESSNSSEWDQVLDSYEKYIDKYVKLYKKAQAGDMSAMTEYASMLEKANDLSSKLNGAKSDMSPAQMARFTKLQSKLISAVQ